MNSPTATPALCEAFAIFLQVKPNINGETNGYGELQQIPARRDD
jgi:hypothetical protein